MAAIACTDIADAIYHFSQIFLKHAE